MVLAGTIAKSAPFDELLNQALHPLRLNTKLEVLASILGEDAPLTGASLAARDLAEAPFWSSYRS
ncbi:hypothetical protein CQ018_06225 [Arthrobacter sp. MYb227]|nr:hypothetical protein CQ018_06225 [Arthrobacter sp. MYb227]